MTTTVTTTAATTGTKFMHWGRIIAVTGILACAFGAAAQQVELEEPNRGGDMDLSAMDPEVALSRLHVMEGFEVSLFASEQDFPIANPVALQFDAQGRLWVLTMPSYPQRLPDEAPDDKLIILEDTTGDGKADKYTVFADNLHVPTGFELGDGGAYIAQQPNLIFAKDTNGDGYADHREILLHGFGTEDSHHSISAFTWDPAGGLYFQEGTFHHSQVETPYGPVRLKDAGVFRYEPRSYRLEVFVSYPFANPWGHNFDEWGQSFVADASGGSNYYGTAFSGHKPYPRKSRGMRVFTSVVRPTSGVEFIKSRHFPDELQGNWLINNTIGFQGTKQHRVYEEGSGFHSEEVENLLHSTDINFRPVDLQFGPDGALYIVDWFNPLIGHMQYSLRDDRRDHAHGRVWRITHKERPLLTPIDMTQASVPELLGHLEAYEDRTRHRARIELRSRDRDEVMATIGPWLDGLDRDHADYERSRLEGLWLHQSLGVINRELLDEVLASPDHRARSAAVRVQRFWRYYPEAGDALETYGRTIHDPHPRVRLETIVALSYHMDAPEAARIALEALEHPTDYYIDYALNETIDTLSDLWKEEVIKGDDFFAQDSPRTRYVLARMSVPDLLRAHRTAVVSDELLTRPGVSVDNRREVVESLAQMENSTPFTVLIRTIERIDAAGGDEAPAMLRDLGALLVPMADSSDAVVRASLVGLASDSREPGVRQHALAALANSPEGASFAMAYGERNGNAMFDLLSAVPHMSEPARAAFADTARALLTDGGRDPFDDTTPQVRYIRIELPGEGRVLTLAEVEVLVQGENVARGGKASQSSTAHGGEASRAIDGNSSGFFNNDGQTHTREESDPWWEVDLGKDYAVDAVRVHNRRDGDTGLRLKGFSLIALDAQRAPVFTLHELAPPSRHGTYALDIDPFHALRNAALGAMASIPGAEAETAALAAGALIAGRDTIPAMRILAALPEEAWPAARLGETAMALADYLADLPDAARTSETALAAFDLADRMVEKAGAESGGPVLALLDPLRVQIQLIRPVPHRMIYDTTRFYVKAGAPVEIIFENTDIMPHNLVITAPGAMAKVGNAAEAMAMDEDAAERQYLPDLPEVLHATNMLYSGMSETLRFTAPSEPGVYPFVCTYPGHWLIMNGTMHVVEEIDDTMVTVASTATPGEPMAERSFVQAWTMDDLTDGLELGVQGGTVSNGRILFEAVGCNTCHLYLGEGRDFGPELTGISEEHTAEELLRYMIEPSHHIEEGYEAYIVDTMDFETFVGFIIAEDDDAITIRTQDHEPGEGVVIARDDILNLTQSPLSIMPTGLLTTLTEAEIHDLLAYLMLPAPEGHEGHHHHHHHGH